MTDSVIERQEKNKIDIENKWSITGIVKKVLYWYSKQKFVIL